MTTRDTGAGTAIAIAHARSLEAELATEQVAHDSSIEAHQHAAQLHHEAAKWRQQAGDERRALRHEMTAKVHARIVVRLQRHDNGEEEST